MKNLYVVIFIIFISSFQLPNDSKELISELGQRYNELGRFSGKILVEKKGEIIFNESFGYANNVTKEAFTDETLFNLGDLSRHVESRCSGQLFLEIMKEGTLEEAEQRAFKKVCAELGMHNTFYKPDSDKIFAKGHEYLNNGTGLKWHINEEDDEVKHKEFYSTPEDFLKLIKSFDQIDLGEEIYTSPKGFNYFVNKIDDLVILIFSNHKHPITKEIHNGVYHILKNHPHYLPYGREEVKIEEKDLKMLEGTYRYEGKGDIIVKVSNDSLFTHFGPTKIYMAPQAKDQFYMPGQDAEIRFISKDNKVLAAQLLDGFMEGPIILKVD